MVSGVVDVTHLLGKEEGSAFDTDNIMFSAFEDGGVFHYESTDFVMSIKEMLTGDYPDAKAQTLESVLTLPIRQASHNLIQGKSSDKVYERVHQWLFNDPNAGGMSTSLNLLVAQMCSAFIYKKAFFEKCWVEDPVGGGVKIDKLAFRPPATCAVVRSDQGNFRGFRQMPIRMDDTQEKQWGPMRSFVYIHGSHRDPLEGVSDLTVTRWCYKTKQKIRYLWYQFLEGQSLPKTIVKNADPDQAIAAAKKIIGLKNGGVVGLDSNNDVAPLEANGKGAAEFKAALQWLDGEASASCLAGFTDLSAMAAGGTGSFALSKDQTDFFLMSEGTKSREEAGFINQYAVADFVYWNFGPAEIAPKFEFGPISQDDASAAISLLQATAQTPVNQSVLPQEFFDELAMKVAGFLEMDVQRVRKALETARKQAEKQAAESPDPTIRDHAQVAGAAAAVDKATNALQQKARADTLQITA